MSFVIGLVGYSNAGKGTYSYFVSRAFGIPSLTTGNIVRAEVRRRNLELNATNIAKVSDDIRKETNNHFMEIARIYLEELKINNKVIIIDSFRELVDKEIIESYSSELKTVGIYADIETRYKRAILRGREGDALTLEGFLELDDRERKLGVDELLKSVDVTIANNGNLVDFYKKSITITKRIVEEWKLNDPL